MERKKNTEKLGGNSPGGIHLVGVFWGTHQGEFDPGNLTGSPDTQQVNCKAWGKWHEII